MSLAEFGAFYEQTVFYTWMVFSSVFVLTLLYRLGRLFFRYINTGGWDKFYESCYGYHLMDGDGLDLKYISLLFRGIHPGAIALDIIAMFAIGLFSGMLWLPLSIILPFVLLALLLRRKIARKQDFVSKLDGTHPDLQDSGDGGMVQSQNQVYTGGGSA
jgi:hypothetical protein